LRLVNGQDYTIVDTDHDERYRDFWQTYHEMMSRKGFTEQMAKLEMRRRTTLIGAMLVKRGEADGMICGMVSTTHRHLHFIDQVIGKKKGCNVYAAMNALVLPGR
ncbi:phosphate acyltransferase, partial [Paraburkholderia hospita]